ncbi:MAG: hypothetical protein ABI746_06605 [Dermatophilaceae bacterium]
MAGDREGTAMALVAYGATVSGRGAVLLPPTDVVAEAGRVTVVAGPLGPSSTAFALALAGRVRLSGGRVTWDEQTGAALRRRKVALVDLPGVTEPEEGLSVRNVVAQELTLAGRRLRRRDVRDFLAERRSSYLSDWRWDRVPAASRTLWLTELALRNPNVEAVVVAHPDRWGGDARIWFDPLRRLDRQGVVLVVMCTEATARLLGSEPTYRIGGAAGGDPWERVPSASTHPDVAGPRRARVHRDRDPRRAWGRPRRASYALTGAGELDQREENA